MKWLSLLAATSLIALPQAYRPDHPVTPLTANEPSSTEIASWLTGTILPPPGSVIPYGQFLVQNYFYCTTTTGTYNSHWDAVTTPNSFSLNPQFPLFFGLTSWMNLRVAPQFFVNSKQHTSYTGFGDLLVGLDFQLYPPDASWFPGIKFSIAETFPTGHFQHLSLSKLGTDITGAGAFASSYGLIFYKVYHLRDYRFFAFQLTSTYTMPLSFEVHGLNAYGGGFGTHGTLIPGNTFQQIVSFEGSLSRHWGTGVDFVYTHSDISKFSGIAGTTATGEPATVGEPSSEQFSIAPEIEYDFSATLALVVGAWFSVGGRNSPQFISGIFELNYTY